MFCACTTIKHVLFAHHDPGARVEQILELKRQTGEYYDSRAQFAAQNKEKTPSVLWDFAHEGLEVKL